MLEALQGQSPTDLAAVHARPRSSPPTSSPSSPASSAPSPPTRRRSISTSTATRRRCWASRSATSSTRCNRRWAAFYVNDFNLFGRTWQVNVQADAPFRKRIDDIYRIYVRNAQGGGWCRSARSARRKLVQGPQTVVRYNGYRAAIINGAAKPGYSSGQALAAMERISAATLPPGYGFEWTGTALQEKAASGQTGIVLGLAVLFAYLFLVALYESWNIPVPVLLSVSVGVLGAHRRGCARRAAASTSMPRSASSCWSRSPPRTAS